MTESAIPLTRSGLFCGALAVVAWVGGWRLGWIELMVLAAGCVLALLVAVPFVIGRTRLRLERVLERERITAGDEAWVTMVVHNDRRTPHTGGWIEEQLRGTGSPAARVPVELPALGPGGQDRVRYRIPADRRGRYRVGPALAVRADPLGLMRRETANAGTQTLWVHPKRTNLRPLPVGFAKDLEGPTSDASPAGDVAFHALRDYQVGDNFRHIHWLSTARTGQVMVRHYVDNRKPDLAVLLDDGAVTHAGESFEIAVEVAASLVVSSKLQQQPLSLWFGDHCLSGRSRPAGLDETLDSLSIVEPSGTGDLAVAVRRILHTEPEISALAVITGGAPTEELHRALQPARRSARVIVTRVWDGEPQRGVLPGGTLFDVADLDSFRFAWDRMGG